MTNPLDRQLFTEHDVSLPTDETGNRFSFVSCVQKCATNDNNVTLIKHIRRDAIDNACCESILVIPVDHLDKPLALSTPDSTALRHIRFTNPQSSQRFQKNRVLLAQKVILTLKKFNSSLEHISLPLDFSNNIGTIICYLSLNSFSGIREIELLRPTTFNLCVQTQELKSIQEALPASLENFNHLRIFTIPLEVVTPSLLLHLGKLPNLQHLTVESLLPSHPLQGSSKSADWRPNDPVTFPGRRFLSHFHDLDTDGYFQALKLLDVGVRDPHDGSSQYILEKLFPQARIV